MGLCCARCRGGADSADAGAASSIGNSVGHYTKQLEEQFLENARAAQDRLVTHADADAFEHPAKPIGVSGGTAAFYAVKYAVGSPRPATHSERHWIGKDLARAEDELSFYERAHRLLADDPTHWRLLRWAFDYGGVADVPCVVGDKSEPRKQLLLRNLFDGAEQLRMLDVKIGAVTAVGGWQGKSHFRATKQKLVDSTTNSAAEGYRAEGFESPPPALLSLLDQTGGKRKHRVALQRLSGAEFYQWWAEMPAEEPTQERLSGSEVACRALRRAVHELVSIVAAAAAVEVPQQWIGSSAAIAFDAASRPLRPPKARPRPGPDAARINVFDWGRSELTTLDMFEALSREAKHERAKHWGEWVTGTLRLAFEAARAYRRRYCPVGGRWKALRLRVWSFGFELSTVPSVTSGTEIGHAVLPLGKTQGAFEVTLHRDQGLVEGALATVANVHVKTLQAVTKTLRVARKLVQGEAKELFATEHATVSITVDGPLPFPEGSDLQERWVVHVHHARHLPKTEVAQWCNPVVTVSLIDEAGAEAVAQTKVLVDTANPVWDEKLEFCSAAPHARESASLLPPELVHAAPAAKITGWDLAAEGAWWKDEHHNEPHSPDGVDGVTSHGGKGGVARALLSFTHCFFRPELASLESQGRVKEHFNSGLSRERTVGPSGLSKTRTGTVYSLKQCASLGRSTLLARGISAVSGRDLLGLSDFNAFDSDSADSYEYYETGVFRSSAATRRPDAIGVLSVAGAVAAQAASEAAEVWHRIAALETDLKSLRGIRAALSGGSPTSPRAMPIRGSAASAHRFVAPPKRRTAQQPGVLQF